MATANLKKTAFSRDAICHLPHGVTVAGCWTHQNTPRPLRGPLQRTCGPRTARGAALETEESRGAAGATLVE